MTATAYAKNDVVREGSFNYVCLVAHASGVFNTDLAANKWMQLGATGTATDIIHACRLTLVDQCPISTSRDQEIDGDVVALTATVAGKQPLDATLRALVGVAS